jgi:dCTP diphosphatase
MNDLNSLRDAVRRFAEVRDWDQFHSPKSLAIALSVEASELLERFQWVSEDQSRDPSSTELGRIREEVADVLIYLVRLADKLGVDPLAAAHEKLQANELKYPVDKARGNSKKYTEL